MSVVQGLHCGGCYWEQKIVRYSTYSITGSLCRQVHIDLPEWVFEMDPNSRGTLFVKVYNEYVKMEREGKDVDEMSLILRTYFGIFPETPLEDIVKPCK